MKRMDVYIVIKKLSLIILVAVVFVSCISKQKYNIVPITDKVIDTIYLKKNHIFISNNKVIDTLKLINKYNIIKSTAIKSITNVKNAGHFIGFDYDSSRNNGTINISLEKDVNNNYLFSINGFCISKDINMSQEKVEKDTIIVIDVEKCDKSNFKKIVFRKFKIEYYETQDGSIWKPAPQSVLPLR